MVAAKSEEGIDCMSGSYLYYRDIKSSACNQSGIDMKVAGQIHAFNSAGLDCRFVYCRQPETLIGKITSSLPFFSDGIQWPDPNLFKEDSYLYIRQPRFASKELVRFLEGVKRRNPRCRIIFELPNYPYDEGMKILLLYCAWLKDKKYRERLSGVVDKIAVIHEDPPETIFGIPSITFFNGVDLNKIKPTRPVSNLKEINIFFAAYTVKGDRRYGTDRLLKGLFNYYKNGGTRKVVAHFAIGGGEAPAIKKQIQTLGLKDHVVFYGEVPWEALDSISDRCSIAMAPLGLHRIGANMSSALKTREYLAKGLPFFFSGGMDIFRNGVADFCYQIPASDDPVDIDRLIKFHDELYAKEQQEDLICRIRDYAQNNVSMEIAMADVIKYIRIAAGDWERK